MLQRILLLAGLTGATYSATAQVQPASQNPARFALERDSLMSHAAAAREQVNGSIISFKTSSKSLGGVRQKTTSYSLYKKPDTTVDKSPITRVKQHVVKHKKSGVLVEKVFYYTPGGHLLLSEHYLNGQLSRLALHTGYQLYNIERSQPDRTVEFVQGDYIRKTYRIGRPAEYYFLARPRS